MTHHAVRVEQAVERRDHMEVSKRIDGDVDDDGRATRTGTMWTASAHIITAVIGSGVLSLSWAMAQLGWAAGVPVVLLFAAVIYLTSAMLTECYRSGDPVTGRRNRTYMDAVRATLGGPSVKLCGAMQFANLFGICVGITIASATSMLAIKEAGCYHERGHDSPCGGSPGAATPYMLLYGGMQIVFSQIPNLDKIWWLSAVAAAMSFTYSAIGISLGVAEIVANGGVAGSLTGVVIGAGAGGVTLMQKVWRSFQAFGNMAFAYGFAFVLLEIQDTLKAATPSTSEVKVMKKAVAVSVATTTVVYLLCACVGYAAFGNTTKDNLLTGFGFYEPYWLLDVANAAVVVHLVGTYQVIAQPIFAFVEQWAAAAWPGSALVDDGRKRKVVSVGPLSVAVSPFRLAWRTAFVCVTTFVSMMLPFFGVMVGLIGAASFWPLLVYFPVEMYIAQRGVPRWSSRWLSLQVLSAGCLVVSLVAAAGSIAGVVDALKQYTFRNPFCSKC